MNTILQDDVEFTPQELLLRLSTGMSSLNEMIQGGFVHGSINTITVDGTETDRKFINNLVYSVLETGVKVFVVCAESLLVPYYGIVVQPVNLVMSGPATFEDAMSLIVSLKSIDKESLIIVDDLSRLPLVSIDGSAAHESMEWQRTIGIMKRNTKSTLLCLERVSRQYRALNYVANTRMTVSTHEAQQSVKVLLEKNRFGPSQVESIIPV